MAAINTRVVQRSNAVMNYAYGSEFKYDEAMMTGGGVLGSPAALAVTGAMGAFGLKNWGQSRFLFRLRLDYGPNSAGDACPWPDLAATLSKTSPCM